MPVVTVSLDTTALSEYNMAELVPVAIKESTTRDMFYSGLHLGTVPGSEGNMTHAHTHAHSTLLLSLTYGHIFLKGVARKVFCFGAARQTAHPSPTWTDSVSGMWASLWPRPCLTTAHPWLVPFLAPAEAGRSSRWKRVCGAHAALTVNHCNMKWQGHHLGNFSALLLGLLDALWQRAAEGRWFYKPIVGNYTQKAEMGTNYPSKPVKYQG